MSELLPESGTIDSFDAAKSALTNAGTADAAERDGTSTYVAPEDAGTKEGTIAAEPPPGQAAETPDSFTRADLNSLLQGVSDPAARAAIESAYKSFQGDYTRNMQQIAPYRQLAEAGVDPQQALQSLEFVQALETDPNFVVAVHQQLSQALEQAGLSPEQASAEAAAQIDSFGAEGEDSALAKEVAELREWRDAQEAQQVQQTMMAELQRAEMSIRQSNPTYTDQDVERVYEMAFAHGGNLIAAAQSYEALRQQFISAYVDQKGTASAAAPSAAVPAAAASSDEPLDMKDPKVASAAAREFFRNALGT